MPPSRRNARTGHTTDVAALPIAGETRTHRRMDFAFHHVRAEPAYTLVEAIAYPSLDPPTGKAKVPASEAWRVDTYGTFMRADTLRRFAHDFMVQGRAIDSDHDHGVIGALVESYLTRDGHPEYPPGVWVTTVKVTDADTRARIAAKKLKGLSIEFFSAVREVKVTFEKIGPKKLGEIVDPLPIFLSLVENPAIRIGFSGVEASDGAETGDTQEGDGEGTDPAEPAEGEGADAPGAVAAKSTATTAATDVAELELDEPTVAEWSIGARAALTADRIDGSPTTHFWRCADPSTAAAASTTAGDVASRKTPEETVPMEIQSQTPAPTEKDTATDTALTTGAIAAATIAPATTVDATATTETPAPAATTSTTDAAPAPASNASTTDVAPSTDTSVATSTPADSDDREHPAPAHAALSADFENALIARVTLAARGVRTSDEFTPEVAADIRKRADAGEGFAAIWAEKKAMTTFRAVAQAAEWTLYCVMDDAFYDYGSTDEGKVDAVEQAAKEFAVAMSAICAEARTDLAARSAGTAATTGTDGAAAEPVKHAARAGKALSKKNLDRLTAICTQLTGASTDLTGMIAEYSEPAEGEGTGDGTATQLSATPKAGDGPAPTRVERTAREAELEAKVTELQKRVEELEEVPGAPRSAGEQRGAGSGNPAPAKTGFRWGIIPDSLLPRR